MVHERVDSDREGYFTDPLKTFGEVADQRTWREGIVFYWLTSVLVWAVGLLRVVSQQSRSAWTESILPMPWSSLLLSIAGPLLVLFSTAILYWAGQRQGGTGPLSRLFTTELFNGAAVSSVSAPFVLVLYLITQVNASLNILADIESFIVSAWSIVLTYFPCGRVWGYRTVGRSLRSR